MNSAVFSCQVSLAMLNALYKGSGEQGRASPNDLRIGWQLGERLVCGARLQRYPSGWLLRNLCTHPDYRGRGLATRCLQQIQTFHHQTECCGGNLQGLPVFTLPLPHLESLYLSQGFVGVTSPAAIDPALLELWRRTARHHKGIRMVVWPATEPVLEHSLL